ESKKIFNLDSDKNMIDLNKQRLRGYLENIIKNIINDDKNIIIPFKENVIIILHNNPKTNTGLEINKAKKEICDKLIYEFKQFGLSTAIGIGPISQGVKGIKNSYKIALRALDLGKEQKRAKKYYIHEFILEVYFAIEF